MARPRKLVARSAIAFSIVGAAALGCEAIAGYSDLEPWPAEASVSGDAPADKVTEVDARDGDSASLDVLVEDTSSGDGPSDREAGPCPVLTGNDACASVPHFTASTQIVDGAGDEFCDVPAMVFDVNACPTLYPNEPPALPERVYLRIAWSTDAFHLHIHVVDPNVVVNPDPNYLWNGDAVEIFVAGTSEGGLNGSYNGSDDGGAIQIVLAPPGAGFPTRGQAFFNPGGGVHESAPISDSIYAGRLVDDGYELELRFPWVAFAEPALAGKRIGFDLAVGAQQDADAGSRQLQCIISDVFVDGKEACGYSPGTPAQPWCDDRTWCQPELLR